MGQKLILVHREFHCPLLDIVVRNTTFFHLHQRQFDQEREERSAPQFQHRPADLQSAQAAGLLAVQVQAVLDHGDVPAMLVEIESKGRVSRAC